MNITYKNLLAFVTLADAYTFAEASERLFVSQPALSTAIKNMELALGGQLFIRSTRRVSLTPEGLSFLPTARRLLNDWDSAFLDLSNLFKLQQGILNISAMPSYAEGELAQHLVRFHQHHPNLKIRLLDEVMERVIEHVLDGRAELGLIFEPEDLRGLLFKPLFIDEFMLVVGPQHALANNTSIELARLDGSVMVAMNKESSVRKWVDGVFFKNGVLPNILAETSTFGTLGQIIAKGLGCAIVPRLCRQLMRSKGCVCIGFSQPDFAKRVGVIMSKRSNLSVPAEAFCKHLLENNKTTTTSF